MILTKNSRNQSVQQFVIFSNFEELRIVVSGRVELEDSLEERIEALKYFVSNRADCPQIRTTVIDEGKYTGLRVNNLNTKTKLNYSKLPNKLRTKIIHHYLRRHQSAISSLGSM